MALPFNFDKQQILSDLHLKDFSLERQPVVWAVAMVIGVVVGSLVVGFIQAIGLLTNLGFGAMDANLASAAKLLPWWQVLIVPTAGGVFVSLLLWFATRDGRAHGIADVIESRALRAGRIDAKTAGISALLSVVSLGSGASLGREGPAVHLGAAFASVCAKHLNYPPIVTRTLMASGAAAAVSASFNAPLAGVLFALEVVLGHYALRTFAPIVIASVAGALVSRAALGENPAFLIPNYHIATYWEMPGFVLLGIASAAVAITFMRTLMATEDLAAKLPFPTWIRPIFGGVILGLIAILVPEILSVGYEPTLIALHGAYGFGFLCLLIGAKIIASAISYGARFAGGVFSPSLFLGAMTGGAFGLIASSIWPGPASSPGLYAIIGTGAVAAAVLGAPISTTLIVFELTRSYDIAIAMALSVSIATVVTQSFLGKSFFFWQLERRGHDLSDGPQAVILQTIRVRDIMGPPPKTPPERTEDEVTLAPDDTLGRTMRLVEGQKRDRILVIDRKTDKVIGQVHAAAAFRRYNAALVESHKEEHS